MENNLMCNLCEGKTEAIGQTKEKIWATSDGHALHACVHLHICSECGHVQKNTDDAYQYLIKNIYEKYQVNLLGGRIDQMNFSSDGSFSSRSSTLVKKIKQQNILNNTGKLLDVGCATGLFLAEVHEEFPHWDLYGQEYDSHFKDTVLKVKEVKNFYTKDDKIKNKLNVICMNHVLEHVMSPVDVLNTHYNLLDDSGLHFVQVPSYLKEPFELCILDHISHFTPKTLYYLAKKCGYSIISTTDGWTQKHTGWLAKKVLPPTVDKQIKHESAKAMQATIANVQNALKWLDELPSFILNYSKGKELGLFGTAPASSWVAESINNQNSFFMDEDINKQGSELMHKMIYIPSDCPNNSCAFLPFAPIQAKTLKERLKKNTHK